MSAALDEESDRVALAPRRRRGRCRRLRVGPGPAAGCGGTTGCSSSSGSTRRSFGGTIEAFNRCVHPDDLPRVSAALERAIAHLR